MKTVLVAVLLLFDADAPTVHWPFFRGPEASGIAAGQTPLSWNADPIRGSLRDIRWRAPIPVPTPIFAHGLIFVTNAHGRPAPLHAIRPEAAGDISLEPDAKTSAGVAWSEPRNGVKMQTPLARADLLYSCSDRGVLKVHDARTGKLHYAHRLRETHPGA